MSKTTQTRFQHCNSSDVLVIYEKDYVIIHKVNSEDDPEETILLDNSEIKRINKIINKNLKENK
jgi:hypothetical protein